MALCFTLFEVKLTGLLLYVVAVQKEGTSAKGLQFLQELYIRINVKQGTDTKCSNTVHLDAGLASCTTEMHNIMIVARPQQHYYPTQPFTLHQFQAADVVEARTLLLLGALDMRPCRRMLLAGAQGLPEAAPAPRRLPSLQPRAIAALSGQHPQGLPGPPVNMTSNLAQLLPPGSRRQAGPLLAQPRQCSSELPTTVYRRACDDLPALVQCSTERQGQCNEYCHALRMCPDINRSACRFWTHYIHNGACHWTGLQACMCRGRALTTPPYMSSRRWPTSVSRRA